MSQDFSPARFMDDHQARSNAYYNLSHGMATNNHTVCLDDFHAPLFGSSESWTTLCMLACATRQGWVGLGRKKKRRFDPTRHDRPDPTRPDPTPTPTTTSTQPRPDPTKPDTAEALDQPTRKVYGGAWFLFCRFLFCRFLFCWWWWCMVSILSVSILLDGLVVVVVHHHHHQACH